MTEQEARAKAQETGGTVYYDNTIGWFVIPPETVAAVERQLSAPRWRGAEGAARLMPPSYWGGTSAAGWGGGAAPTPGVTPSGETPTVEGEDIFPVSEMSPGVWLYSDGMYRDEWGLPSEGMTAEEAKAQVEEETGMAWLTEGSVVIPGQLIRMPDNTYVDYQFGVPVDTETALYMLEDYFQTGATQGMTENQLAEIDLLTRRLEFDMQQAGIGDEQQWAQIDLQRQQLELQRNEWMAQLQASPATWVERWEAERMPWGGERIPLESDVQLAQWAGGQALPTTATQRVSASATAALPRTPSQAIPDMATRAARMGAPRIGRTP